jgi:hypothetical protein
VVGKATEIFCENMKVLLFEYEGYKGTIFWNYNIFKWILQLDFTTIATSVNWTSWVTHIRISLVWFMKGKYIAFKKKYMIYNLGNWILQLNLSTIDFFSKLDVMGT